MVLGSFDQLPSKSAKFGHFGFLWNNWSYVLVHFICIILYCKFIQLLPVDISKKKIKKFGVTHFVVVTGHRRHIFTLIFTIRLSNGYKIIMFPYK